MTSRQSRRILVVITSGADIRDSGIGVDMQMSDQQTTKRSKGEPPARRHKHEKLREHLVGLIAAGELQPGDALASELQLTKLHGVSRTTVREAIGRMERDGLVRRVHGSGTFVADDVRSRLPSKLDAFALILPQTSDGTYPAILEGFQSGSRDAHHQVIVCSTLFSISRQAEAILQVMDKGVAGVAILPDPHMETPAYQIRQLTKQAIPVVFCHRPVDGVRAPVLRLCYRRVGVMAGEALVQQGHSRAGLFVHRASKAGLDYEDGLRSAMQAGGGDLPDEFVFRSDPVAPDLLGEEQEIEDALKRMLDARDRPTGIMSTFDSMGEMVYVLLGRMGVKMPDDVSLVSFGGAQRRGAMQQQLSAVTVDGHEIGRRAAELLAEVCDGRRPLEDDEDIVRPLGFHDGRTLGPVSV